MKEKIFAAAVSLFAASHLFGAQIYLSPNGSDTAGDGGLQKPFATLAKAVDVASKTKGASEIVLAEGIYFMPEKSVVLKGYPTAESPLTIRGTGKVLIHGGVRIAADNLKEVRNVNILKKLPSKKEGKLFALDLKKFGVKGVGALRPYGFGTPSGAAQTEAFFSKMPLTIAKYPNQNAKMPLKTVVENGYDRTKPNAWDKSKEKNGGVFAYEDSRHERWTDAKDLWLSGIFHYGWAFNTVKVKKIDAEKKTVTLENQLPWGVQKGHKKIAANAYQAINLLEEIDINGEYYIDRENLIFYVMLDRFPAKGEYFDFSLSANPFISAEGVSNLTIKNIDFTTNRVTTIVGKKCDKFAIDGCEFFNIGAAAVSMESASVDNHSPQRLAEINNELKNCKVHDTGAGGVYFKGGNEEKLLPSHNKISNSEFWKNGRLQKSHSPHVDFTGVGGILSHCYFHDESYLSVWYTGSEHVIEYNRFERCCQGDFDDIGAVYTGRLPYNRGNIIRYNFFSHIEASHKTSMICGIYIDDGSGGTLIEKNIFCRVGTPGRGGDFSAVYFHGGKDNVINDNVFIDCDVAASQVQWNDYRWKTYWENMKPHVKYVDSEIYLKKYPELKDILNPSLKRMNTMKGGKLFRTQPPLRGKWDLRLPMQEMQPDIPFEKTDTWNIAKVKKYFGRDYLVNDILSKTPGVKN